MKIYILFLLVLTAGSLKSQKIDSFTDPRDGEVYATVKIGKQIWMAENLRYNLEGSYLNPDNPNKKYGRLFTWEQAIKACPKGWHLPTDKEWNKLEKHLGLTSKEAKSFLLRGNHAESLMSKEWQGNNSSGFNALPAGYYSLYFSSFVYFGSDAFFWTSTMENHAHAWGRSLSIDYKGVSRYFTYKNYKKSCRCVKD